MATDPTPAPPYFAELMGIQQIPPGYVYKNVKGRVFPLQARYDEVAALVGEILSGPTGLDITPLPTLTGSTAIYLEVLEYGYIASTAPVFKDWGFMTQRELLFTIPVIQWDGGMPQPVQLFTPYNFVDNAWSMLAGNMLLGYPKAFGWFELPAETSVPMPIRVATQVFPEFSPDTPLSWETLLSVEEGFGIPPDLDVDPERLWPLGHLDLLFGKGGPLEVEPRILTLLKSTAATRSFGVMQRKQLRDIMNPELACFLSIVTLERRLDRVIRGGFLPPLRIDLRDYASLPIAARLGLSQTEGPLDVLLPFWMELDFGFLDPAVEFTTAPSGEGPPDHPQEMGGWAKKP